MNPLSINLAPVDYWNPCPFRNQAWAGKRGRASASTATILVPFSSLTHSYTLVTSPDVRSLSVDGVSVPIVNGRATFDVQGTPGHGTLVALGTKADPPISIIRTDWLDLEGEIYAPDFLDAMAGAAGFRFMDWADTNDTTLTAWTPDTAESFHGAMVPVEHMAALCNKTGADMWLTLPASIPMEEAGRVIRLARSLVLPWIKINVEWSNEVWNTLFPVGKVAAAAPGGASAYYGQKSADLGKVIATIPGVELMLCWQYVSSPQGKQAVIDAYQAAGGPMDVWGGFGIAPYAWNSGKSVATYLANNDQAGLLDDLAANQAKYAFKMAETVAVLKPYGKPVLFYEAGLQANARGNDQIDFAAAATRTERAGEITAKIWADADAAGVGDRYAYCSAGQKQFGFWPDYDADPYPSGKVWAQYNRRAWPMVRAVKAGPDLSGLASDIAVLQKGLAAVQGRLAAAA